LSYASEDAPAAQRICEALRAAGIEVWFDRSELRGGDAWDVAIRRQIKACALFMPIISANTRARVEGYFRLEWKLAVDRSHLIAAERAFLLPIVIDETLENDALVPDRFRELQWTRLRGGFTSPEFIDRVARLLKQDQPAGRAQNLAAMPQPPAARASRAPAGTKALLGLGAAALLIGAGIFALNKFSGAHRTANGETAAPTVLPVSAVPKAVPDKSIAVLPFVDMSEKHDQAYFSDGLAEELLDLLAKVPGLTVIARTSSFSFKDKSEDIPTIARKLNVANVLEGSVRKSGRRLRITTQLIRADSGAHIWSETYDRDEDDVFKVQEDIARAVVEKLKLALLGDVPISAARTSNPEVYNLFLQGRYAVAFDTAEEVSKSIDCYRKAIALDSNYAPAWAAMSYAIVRQIANGYIMQASEEQAMAAARRAVELDPTLADGYNMIGTIKMIDFDWLGAREALDRALKLEPNNLNSLFYSAHLTMTVGNADDTLVQFRDVLERDPLNLLYRRYVARVLYYAGRLTEAEAMIRQVLAISPSFPAAHYELGRILLARGQIPAAVTEFEAENSSAWRAFGLPLGYHAQGRSAEANAALESLVKSNSAGAEFQVAETYAVFGNADKAFAWFDEAVEKRDPGLQWLRGNPMTRNLVGDPRYAALLRRLKLPP
jgi:TolB-like protein/Tfp pilus assembly protein PilF